MLSTFKNAFEIVCKFRIDAVEKSVLMLSSAKSSFGFIFSVFSGWNLENVYSGIKAYSYYYYFLKKNCL